MTLRRKFLIRISSLTLATILAMSGTYYMLFTRHIRERSHQNVEMTFNLILDDLSTKVETVSSKIDAFIESSLAGPMYTIQLLQSQQDSSDQEAVLWSVKRRMTYLHILTTKMREFGTLVEASEILIYGNQGDLVATYYLESDGKTTLVYFSDIWETMVVPIQPDDRWFATIQALDEVPLQSIPEQTALTYQDTIPARRELVLTTHDTRVLIQFRVPIRQDGDVQGICVLNMAIRQQDVERYASLTGNEVNVFAGTTLSVGSLTVYNFFPDEHSALLQSAAWLSTGLKPDTTFSEIKIRKNSYYQGVLALGTSDRFLGAITVLFPRSLEEEQTRYFLMIVAVVTLIFGILVLFEAFGLSGAVGKPLAHLMDAMQRIKSGDLDVQAPVETNDEVGRLAETFNTMAAQLKDSIAQIEEHRQEVERQNQELQRLDKLKDDFLANTSHELRTPLHGITGLTDAILRGADGPLTENERQHVQMIQQSSTRLTNLVTSLLDFSKTRSEQIQLHITPFPLEEVTEVVCAFSRELVHDKPVELRVDLPDNLPEIYADIDRVEQILTNLVGNAIKFTKEGTVTISAQVENDWVRISIADTGIGIPDEALERIFNPFEQADGSITREFGGTGLGLAITKELVKLHGGQLWVESEEGVGSTFFVTLPCTENVIPSGKRREGEQSAISDITTQKSGNEQDTLMSLRSEPGVSTPDQESFLVSGQDYTVLVIDDDPTNVEVLRSQLDHAGFNVLTATNGQEAFEVINGYEVDVILCDVMMPGVDGYTFAMRMREHENLQDTPLIFVSAKDQKQDVVKGYSAGGVEYLVKPVAHDELLMKVRALVGLRQRSRERYIPPGAIGRTDHVYDVEQEKDDQFTNIRKGNGETILVVDDEPINIEVLKAQLRLHDYRVVTAANGPEALKLIESEPPDLVLLDLMMPKMSGFRVCQILREKMRLRELPVIMLTAKSHIYDKVYGLNIGANDYVVKPFYLDELLTRIHVLLNIASLQRKLLATNESLQAEVIERTQAEEALQVEVAEHRKTAEELREVNEQLARLNDELEHRVEERTLELQASLDSLKATQQHLVQSEKMAALGGLVAGIAHEMNTPIGVCITASSLLQEKTEDLQSWLQTSQLTRTMLDNYLELAANSSAMLVRNLQQTATLIQNFKQAAVEEDELVGRAFKLKEQVERSLLPLYHDELHNSPHRVCVSGDEAVEMESFPGAITQVVTSLVMNSLIHAFPDGHAGEIRLDISSQDDQALMVYSDNGRGIPAKHRQHIFDPFFTTTRTTGGTGLGLHIVYNLVTHKLKGTIICQSKEGTGTTFIITLPLKLPGAKPLAS